MSSFKNEATSLYFVLIRITQAIGQPSGLKLNVFLFLSLISGSYHRRGKQVEISDTYCREEKSM